MSYIVFKTIDGKKHYWAATSKWIKTTPGAACYSREQAAAKAKELGAAFRYYASKA